MTNKTFAEKAFSEFEYTERASFTSDSPFSAHTFSELAFGDTVWEQIEIANGDSPFSAHTFSELAFGDTVWVEPKFEPFELKPAGAPSRKKKKRYKIYDREYLLTEQEYQLYQLQRQAIDDQIDISIAETIEQELTLAEKYQPLEQQTATVDFDTINQINQLYEIERQQQVYKLIESIAIANIIELRNQDEEDAVIALLFDDL